MKIQQIKQGFLKEGRHYISFLPIPVARHAVGEP